jgi:hypothetical protein
MDKFDVDAIERPRWLRALLAIDQLLNVLLWNGSENETISSHIGRRMKNNKANVIDKCLCSILRKIESKHCFKSIGE